MTRNTCYQILIVEIGLSSETPSLLRLDSTMRRHGNVSLKPARDCQDRTVFEEGEETGGLFRRQW
jgi:hypothetical protein